MGLLDVYTQRPYAPAQDVLQQQDRAFGNMPGLAAQGMQMDAQRAETARQNRPVTPWQKAIMDLMAGKDPKAVAAETKGAMAGSPGAGLPGGGAGIAMPQPLANRSTPLGQPLPPIEQRVANLKRNEMNADQTGMARPVMPTSGPGTMSDAMYSGMNNRDYGDYMEGMSKVRNAKVQKSQQDLMELELERSRRAREVANIGAGAKRDVAETGAGARVESANIGAGVKREELDRKKKWDKHMQRYHADYIDVLRNRQTSYDSYLKGKAQDDQEFKALLESAKKAGAVYGAVAAQPYNNLTEEGQAVVDDAHQKWMDADNAVKEYAKTNRKPVTETEQGRSGQSGYKAPESQNFEPEGITFPGRPQQPPAQQPQAPAKKQAASKKWKVGDSFMLKNKQRRVNAVNAAGQVTAYSPMD